MCCLICLCVYFLHCLIVWDEFLQFCSELFGPKDFEKRIYPCAAIFFSKAKVEGVIIEFELAEKNSGQPIYFLH